MATLKQLIDDQISSINYGLFYNTLDNSNDDNCNSDKGSDSIKTK